MNDMHTEVVEENLKAFIFPNTPVTQEEIEAFSRAVYVQAEHEKQMQETYGSEGIELPNGVSSFSIGHFSMSFAGNGYQNGAVLTKDTICPTAYSILLRAGLLYRGVDTREG